MDTKHLLYGIGGFILGGFIVSLAATTFEKPAPHTDAQVIASLKEKNGDAFDKAYIEHMIVHHQSAVDMSVLAADRAKHEEIKKLGKDIIATQSKEIDMLQRWQVEWDYKDAPVSHRTHQ